MPSDLNEATVVVVGAGASGAVVSHTLAEAGIDVLCLEQGDWVNPSDYPANHTMWELVARGRWATEPNVRRNPADYPLGIEHSDLPPSMYNAVGGSTIHYGAQWPRLVPSDFRVRTVDHVAEDWPIEYHDLAPFHDETDRFLGVAGLDGDTAYPEGLEYPQPPHPLGKLGVRAAEAMNSLGWHWWPAPNAIPTQKHGDLAACARWGTCVQGCPEGAKTSFDLAYWPAALRAGARLETGARVSRITTDSEGRATGVAWIDTHGNPHLVRSEYVVLCANGIGTPRLLLLSATASHPDGLANSSGLVGRNLMLHPNTCVLGHYEDDLESWRGPFGAAVGVMEFYNTDADRGVVRGFRMMASHAPGLILNGVDTHRLLGFDQLWGVEFHRVQQLARSSILWAAIIEDLPEESNRVTLSDLLTDSSGLPAVDIHYRFSENTRALQQYSIERMREAHVAAGAVMTVDVPIMPGEPGHLLGTARMGDDPMTSVVNSFGRAHDSANLRIADGSIFVTSGAVNPTSTIVALALRIARDLIAEIGTGAGAE